MHRIRLSLPPGATCRYKHQDTLHDSLVNAWLAAGANDTDIIGSRARPWNFAALGYVRPNREKRAHTLVVSTPDPVLSNVLRVLEPKHVVKEKVPTSERVEFFSATISVDPAPLAPQQRQLSVLMLSPLAISTAPAEGRRWHDDLTKAPLAAAVNTRLSRLASREVRLGVTPDQLYLRGQDHHEVVVPIKRMADGKTVFVIGMVAPLVLTGSDEDLALAWYTGIGEQTRMGFGCIGSIERGLGR